MFPTFRLFLVCLLTAAPAAAQIPTQTRLAVTPSPSQRGQEATLFATVWATDGTPAGDVAFTSDGTPLGTVALAALGPDQGRVVGGESHGCAIAVDGQVQCWGWNGDRQLGDGTLTNRPAPVTVQGLPGGDPVVQLAAGGRHTCAVTESGALWCWGYNASGQLGVGTITQVFVPVQVPGFGAGTRHVAAGGNHTCAVDAAGGAWCWGSNIYGQLGDGTLDRRTSPTAVPGFASGVAQVAAGERHSCFVLTNGRVRCWGDNTFGQLGDGTTTASLLPVPVVNGRRTAQLAAGAYHTCMVRDGSTRLRCWGRNAYGQLGDGTSTTQSAPVTVPGLAVTAFALGGNHSCAIDTRARAWCWGRNAAGQVGDGTQVNTTSPTRVQFAGRVRNWALAAQSNSSCAQRENGALTCWGSNTLGQTGDGTTTSPRLLPVAVVGGAFAWPRAAAFARLVTSTLPRGRHELRAAYPGSATHAGSTSAAVRHRVQR
ncbi:MAG: chromosome condensation regulator RCC1 [Rhodobacter sp.]|nr:hypothetical protein [Paracoccaceae bacterium]MCC0076391.1 chromosome condensation regulator RCC1 [Rhodobacter sp.]